MKLLIKLTLALCLLFSLAGISYAQEVFVSLSNPQPGPCSGGKLWVNNGSTTIQIFICNNENVWVPYAPAGMGTGNVVGPSSTLTGYIPLWNNNSGSALSGGLFPSAAGGRGFAVIQSNGNGLLDPTYLPALTGDVTTAGGAAATTVVSTHLSAPLSTSQGGSGSASLTGVLVGNGASPFAVATNTNIIGLWTGSCSASTYLRGDGSCGTPPGTSTGTVTNSVSLTAGQLMFGNGTTAITTGNLTGDASTPNTNVVTVRGINGVILSTLATGILKLTTGTGIPSIAANTDVISLWTGSCSSATYLRADGTCNTPSGSGTVTNSVNLTTGQLIVGNSVAAVTVGNLSGDATTSGSTAVTVTKLNGTLLSGLSTGLMKITTSTGVPSTAVLSDVIAYWSGTCSSSNFLRGDGACATPVGSGTATTIQNSSTLPGTCNVGDVYFSSNSAIQPGRNVYNCVASNTWVQAQGGATSLTPSSSGALAPSPSIDYFSTIYVAVTNAGLNFTLPTPTEATVAQTVTVINNGNVATPNYSFVMGGSNIQPGTSILAIWNPALSIWHYDNPPTPGPNVYVVGLGCKEGGVNHSDTNCISNITAAYNDGQAAGYKGIKIIDNTLTYSSATSEVLNNSPWAWDGSETPIDLELGPGVLYMSGPFAVPHASHVHGFGRSNSNGAIGTLIEPTTTGCNSNLDSASCYYGGIYTVATTGGTTCQVGDEFNVIDSGGHGSGAILKVATVFGGAPTKYFPVNMGGGYGASSSYTLTSNGSTHCLATALTVTGATLDLTGVNVGNYYAGAGGIFGSRLTKLTINGGDVNCFSGWAVENAQEQSIVDEVNVTNWGGYACPSNITGGGFVHGIWVHGQGAGNLVIGDVEVNGCNTSDTKCKISAGNKEVAIENGNPNGIRKITHNPINSVNSSIITGATCAAGSPAVVTLTFTSALQSQFGPIGGPYLGSVNITGVTPTGYNGNFVISGIADSTHLAYNLPNGVSCPGSYTSSTGTASPLPVYGIWVCSGTSGCDDNAPPFSDAPVNPIPTDITLTAAHCENTDTCLAVTGFKTSVLDLSPTSTVGTTARLSTHIIGACGSNPWNYTAFDLGTNGSLSTNETILDDCAPALQSGQTATKQDSVVPFYHTGSSSMFAAGYNPQSGSTYTVLPSDCSKMVGYTGSASATYTLTKINNNASSTMGYGCEISFTNIGTGSLTVAAGSTNTIDTASSVVVGVGKQLQILSDGNATWHVVFTTASGSGTVTNNAGVLVANTLVNGTNGTADIETLSTNPTVDGSGNVTLTSGAGITAPNGMIASSSVSMLINGAEAVPSTPASMTDSLYFDPTNHIATEMTSSGTPFATMVQIGNLCTSGQVANGYLASGAPNCVSGGSGGTVTQQLEFQIGGCGVSGASGQYGVWSVTQSVGIVEGCGSSYFPFLSIPKTAESFPIYAMFTFPSSTVSSTGVNLVLSGFASANGASGANTVKLTAAVACWTSGVVYTGTFPTFTSTVSNTVVISNTGATQEAGLTLTAVPFNGCTAGQHAVLMIKRVTVTSDLSSAYNITEAALTYHN